MKIETKMPDELYIEDGMICEEFHAICTDSYCYADNKAEKMQEIASRYNSYQAVVAERDALKTLCEQMADCLYGHPDDDKAIADTLTAYEKHKGADDDQR